jgi:hypothetical protein
VIWRRVLFLAGVSSTLLACGALIGIQDLGVDPASPTRDSAVHIDAAEPVDGPPSEEDDSAAIVDSAPPVILDASTPRRRVFLTSGKVSGGMGGVSGAETLCRAAASNGKLGGNWVPFVSGDGTNAIDRLDFDGPYVTLSAPPIVVVAHKDDIRNKLPLGHLIDIQENGIELTGSPALVWTGSDRSGNATPYNCNNWMTGNGTAAGIAGSFDQVSNGKWIQNDGSAPFVGTFDCGTQAHLYCFELTN